MPAIASHCLFASDVLAVLAPEWAKAQQALVLLGSQGPDPLFFYGRIPWRRRRRAGEKLPAALGSEAHAREPEWWFEPLLRGASGLEGAERERAFALVYGFLLHYQLDHIGHPFMFSRSGFDANGELSAPWNARHSRFEALCDVAMLAERGLDLKRIRLTAMLRAEAKDVRALSHWMASCFPEALERDDFYLAWQDMQMVYRVMRDIRGVKTSLVKKLGLGETQAASFLTPALPSRVEAAACLALDGTVWPDPLSGQTRTESFPELYSRALHGVPELTQLLEQWRAGSTDMSGFISFFDAVNHDGVPVGQRMQFWAGATREGVERVPVS